MPAPRNVGRWGARTSYVWFDASLEAGETFNTEISRHVRAARVVLVCWTPDAFPHGGDSSGWVVSEAAIGREGHVHLSGGNWGGWRCNRLRPRAV
jgi:hypothetical protein